MADENSFGTIGDKFLLDICTSLATIENELRSQTQMGRVTSSNVQRHRGKLRALLNRRRKELQLVPSLKGNKLYDKAEKRVRVILKLLEPKYDGTHDTLTALKKDQYEAMQALAAEIGTANLGPHPTIMAQNPYAPGPGTSLAALLIGALAILETIAKKLSQKK